ncbi:probable aspartyl protease At4g16563 [Euphorbia lathyris]|uniref:probable aspartyl protease At4g16563 n=1 Tax=Euphorbia lathyris TaxID=212925 RepID=UPI003313CC65
MASLSLLCYLLLHFLLSISSSSSKITIPLSHNSFTTQNPFQNLNQLVLSSISRAHHLKNPNPHPHPAKTQLFSHSYGGYSISLSFGTPPQTMSFVMDTGSDFVWFPCTNHYLCKNCTFHSSAGKISPFIPKRSLSSKIIGCKNPKCSWIHYAQLHCPQCDNNNRRNCSQICPPYFILYGSGSTGGIAISETLHVNALKFPNFLVGCSVFSSRQPAGIAGFGRGPLSLPNQLGLTKFSYCLISHKFDDTPKSSALVLDSDYNSGTKTTELMYTPFVENPKVKDRPSFAVYYYIGLRRISVGGRSVKIPYKYLSPGKDGNGGTVIDSGTTFTFMAGDAFEKLSSEVISQVKKYKRAVVAERLTGLKPCFNVSGDKILGFPKLTLHFKGGADVELPTENSFAFVGEDVACLTVVSDGVEGPEERSGPGIILGNFQMQNFHVEYDLRNQRLGFKKELCK